MNYPCIAVNETQVTIIFGKPGEGLVIYPGHVLLEDGRLVWVDEFDKIKKVSMERFHSAKVM